MIRRVSAEKNLDRMLKPILDTARLLWYSLRMKESHNDRQVRTVRLTEGFIDDGGTLVQPGQEVFAVFPPDPGDSEGACYPLYYSGVQLFPDQYEIVVSDREYDKLLEG